MSNLTKLTAAAAILALAVAACSEASSGVGVSSPGAPGCAESRFDRDSARPSNTVRIATLPADFDDVPAVHMTGPEDYDTLTIPVANHPEAGSYFVVPILPSSPVEGGQVEMQLIDAAGAECDPTDFEIEELPSAPGAYKEFAAEIDNLNEAVGDFFGVRPPDGESAGPELQPFDTANEWIEGPENPNSIEKIVDGTAEISDDLTDEGERIFDGIIEEAGVIEHIQETITDIADPPGGTDGPPADDPPADDPPADDPPVEADDPPSQPGNPICERIGTDLSAQTLSRLMQTQGNLEQFRDDTDLILDGVGLLNGVIGTGSLIVTGGVPNPVAAVTGIIGVSLSAYDLLSDAAIHMLPAEFSELDFDYDSAHYLEDAPDLSGYWENVRVTARGKEWNMDGRILETVIGRATGGISKRFISKHGADKAALAASDFLTDTFSSSTAAAIDAHRDGSGFVNIPPCDFGPVDISDPEFHEADFILPNRPATITGDREYEIVDTGKVQLVIRARADKFGGKTVLKGEPVEADPIEIAIEPPAADGDPGFTAVFTVTVENAHDPGIDVTLDPSGGHELQVDQTGDNTYEVTVLTSTERADFPALLRVESTASEGLRAKPDAPPRVETARIGSEGEVTLNPRAICLEPGESFQFEAEVHEFDNQEVVWDASGGKISSSGMFTAPGSPEQITVHAAAAADTDRAASSKVTVAESCQCWASFELPMRGVHEVGSSGTIRIGDKTNRDGELHQINFDMESGAEIAADFFSPLPGHEIPERPNRGPKSGETGRFQIEVREGYFSPTGKIPIVFNTPLHAQHLGGIRYSEHKVSGDKEKEIYYTKSYATVTEFTTTGDSHWLELRASGEVWVEEESGIWRREPMRLDLHGEFSRSQVLEENLPDVLDSFMEPLKCGSDGQ